MKPKEANVISQRWWDVACEDGFVEAVLDTYVSLPQTPDGAETEDRRFASELYRQGYELYNVEAALLLGSIRRIFSSRLSFQPTMRSLKEFTCYIEELRDERLELEYVRYLRHLLSPVFALKPEISAQTQK
jgi:hypothetical protein